MTRHRLEITDRISSSRLKLSQTGDGRSLEQFVVIGVMFARRVTASRPGMGSAFIRTSPGLHSRRRAAHSLRWRGDRISNSGDGAIRFLQHRPLIAIPQVDG